MAEDNRYSRANTHRFRAITTPHLTAVKIASYLLTSIALWLILQFKLLGSLLAGVLVFQLIHLLTPPLEKRLPGPRARLIAVALLAVIITSALAALILAASALFQHNMPSVQELLDQLMLIIDKARDHLPAWLWDYLPDGENELREHGINLLKSHFRQLQQGGMNFVVGIVHVALGMIIGALIAVGVTQLNHREPLAAALIKRASCFSETFRRIVFAQVKISFINAVATGIYLLFALPLFGTTLPLSKTLVLITFVVGLLPVAGNLISNTLIVVISLSTSLSVAIASLTFLVVIHKFEYFLNARIIGGQIEARAWELLLAMVAMEAAFGISGVIAAPIYYAYLKRELMNAKLV